ncbi:MAG: hypothetical protein GQ557_02865 [Mycoplasmataceae bacterium]|nr:hypothetical protein [Mycoplasmataceae bacterium]
MVKKVEKNYQLELNSVTKLTYASFILAICVILVLVQIPVLPLYALAIDLSLFPLLFCKRHISKPYAYIIALIYPWFSYFSYMGGGLVGASILVIFALTTLTIDSFFFNEKKTNKKTDKNTDKKKNESFKNIYKSLINYVFLFLSITFVIFILNAVLFYPLFLNTSETSWFPFWAFKYSNSWIYYLVIVFALTFFITVLKLFFTYILLNYLEPRILHLI